MKLEWKKTKDEKGKYWSAGVYRISKIGRRDFALISVERIKMTGCYSFLAYLTNSLKDAKTEAEIYEEEKNRTYDKAP